MMHALTASLVLVRNFLAPSLGGLLLLWLLLSPAQALSSEVGPGLPPPPLGVGREPFTQQRFIPILLFSVVAITLSRRRLPMSRRRIRQ